MFTDTSTQADGTVSYARGEDNYENVQVHLIMSTVRAAPPKYITLPRLKILGALMGSRISKFLTEASVGKHYDAD